LDEGEEAYFSLLRDREWAFPLPGAIDEFRVSRGLVYSGEFDLPGSLVEDPDRGGSSKPAEVEHRWYVIDASDQVLGRLATRVASVLRGKHKAIYTPHVDTGDFVVVVNAEKIKLTGRKREQKTYYRHTGYTGSLKSTTAAKLLDGPHADRVVRKAVEGMLPHNSLGRQMFRKLKVYSGPQHPHAAQQPKELPLV